MTETKDNSSLPLLLSITGAVLVVVAGGWYLLDRQSTVSTTGAEPAVEAPATAVTTEDEALQLESPQVTTKVAEPAASNEAKATDVDAELRKARLAADADMLMSPPNRSALYYYSRVLEADPGHALALAELDGVLGSLAMTVSRHLDNNEYEAAYGIAALVAKQSPEHELVTQTQQTLDSLTEARVAEAIQYAQDGDNDRALEVLATARALPGRNPEYFTAVIDSITEIQNVRIEADQDRARRARLENDEAKDAWMTAVQQAIELGNLVTPAGASARDLLAEGDRWPTERGQLTTELVATLTDLTRTHINNENLSGAETALGAALELGGDPEEFADLRASLNRALIDVESRRVANMKELVQTKRASPNYPRRALERGVSGWVDVFFTISPEGGTTEITVRQSDPKKVFDKAAMEAVAKWEFQPVEFRGQIISQRAAARLKFQLDE